MRASKHYNRYDKQATKGLDSLFKEVRFPRIVSDLQLPWPLGHSEGDSVKMRFIDSFSSATTRAALASMGGLPGMAFAILLYSTIVQLCTAIFFWSGSAVPKHPENVATLKTRKRCDFENAETLRFFCASKILPETFLRCCLRLSGDFSAVSAVKPAIFCTY